VDIYNEAPKLLNKFSIVKSASALQYVMAGLHRKKSGYDDSLILNTEGYVAEAVSSNIFLVLHGEVCNHLLTRVVLPDHARNVSSKS
jgi:branched-chain amino acid aminotransferase